MTTLMSPPVAPLLERLFAEADSALKAVREDIDISRIAVVVHHGRARTNPEFLPHVHIFLVRIFRSDRSPVVERADLHAVGRNLFGA